MVDYRKHYESAAGTTINRLIRTDFCYYLPDDILTKVDRASMAVGLEARVPMLDHKVCEFALSLPDKYKIRNGIKKYLLKRVGKELLPENYFFERKQGFSVPLREWMQGSLGDKVIELVEDNKSDSIIDRRVVYQLLREHRGHKNDHSSRLWSLLVFIIW